MPGRGQLQTASGWDGLLWALFTGAMSTMVEGGACCT